MERRPLPIGVDSYKKMIEKGYYYVDKTLFIKDLIDLRGEVNLFTRPRRFGKTLNMSMLRYFFEKSDCGDNRSLFAGTKIMDAGERYLSEMGKYPVISVSLKSMKQADYKSAFYCLKEEIAREFGRHSVVAEKINSEEKRNKYKRFTDGTAASEEYLTALQFLSECLKNEYGTGAVILIDEYDVPLENAFFHGFYTEMMSLIRSLLESALKTNEALEFAVITGCLRISRESIFTGLNNLAIVSIMDSSYAEYFGFTQSEVEQILVHYGLEDKKEIVKQWYDGYKFGQAEVYNPWSLINYVNSLYKNRSALPRPYWSNTSSNSIVRTLIERADLSVKQEIEALIEGCTIKKPVHEDITYEDLDSTQDNLWNFLFFTGYLKKISECLNGETIYVELAVPNREVRYIYKNSVLQWFEKKTEKKDLSPLYDSLLNGDCERAADILSENLMETISFYDYQESYYHGFLVGMLKNISNYIVLSNRESGNGRPDILLKYPSVRGKAVIIEIKVAKSYQELEEKCDAALQQIEDRKYEEPLRQEGYNIILKYGIAFYKKDCMVKDETEFEAGRAEKKQGRYIPDISSPSKSR